MHESTSDQDQITGTQPQWCVVYDEDTGFVVHIHQYLAADDEGRCPTEELAQAALAQVESDRAEKLRVLDCSTDELPERRVHMRVDVNSATLVVEAVRRTQRPSG